MELDLEQHLEEVQEFHNREAFDRIETWYHGDPDGHEVVARWDAPPHTFMCESAGELIRFGIEVWDEQMRRSPMDEYPPVGDIRDILLVVGTEYLLTGIAMREDTDWFINYCNERDRTPSFGNPLGEKVPEWLEALPEDQEDRVKTVLQTLQAHRNNLVHFSFHQTRHNPDYPAYYDVLAYLFATYFDSELPVVDDLRNHADRRRRIHSNVEYQWLYFDFND